MAFPCAALYLCWKRTRRPRLVADFRIRKAAWPELSGRETLAAANSRLRCVLFDGCPVLSVHFSFGLAPHIGQRTDNMCFNVSVSGFTAILFNIAGLKNGSILLFGIATNQNGNVTETTVSPSARADQGMSGTRHTAYSLII